MQPCEACLSLRVVDRVAVALLTGGILHVLQALLLIFQLSPCPFHFLLLFLLSLVPLRAAANAVGWSKLNRIVKLIDLALQGTELILLRLNLRLPLLR